MRKEFIPNDLQELVNTIENVRPELAKLPIPRHPDLPFNQFMVVHGVVIALRSNYLKVHYSRQFEDDNGKIINITKESPEWVITEQTTTPILDAEGKPFIIDVENTIQKLDDEGNVILDEQGNPVTETTTTKEPKRISTIKYLTYLQQTNKVSLIDLVSMYAVQFINDNLQEFNK
jgi:hypothetical protein